MWIWDNWFVREGTHWHAFYLELPKAVGPDRRWTNNDFHKHVGHAISDDLIHWQDAGPALVALSDTWNDRHIATGSIIHHENRWWMFFTGRGRAGDGVGLALSDDLMSWKTEPRPLFPLLNAAQTNSEAFFESQSAGAPRRWAGISDPYIYPEPIDGWFYLVMCSRVLQTPIEESGCLTLLRSRDLRQWEAAGIMAWPHCFERMETPQLWAHDGRWYLSFGGVLNMPWVEAHQDQLPAAVRGQRSHQNYVYALADFHQPAGEENLHRIAVGGGSYIMKVLSPSPDPDVAIFTSTDVRGTCLSRPSRVTYLPDGSLQLVPLSPPELGH
jgi:beta-fructofuranosidase